MNNADLQLLTNEEREVMTTPTRGLITPVDEKEKKKFFDMYTFYALKNKDVYAIAKHYGITPERARGVIRWCRHEIGDPTEGPAVEDLVYRLMMKRKEMRELMDHAKEQGEIKDLIALMREDRMNDVVLSRVKGWMNNDINIQSNKQINVILPNCAEQTDGPTNVVEGNVDE